METSTNQKIHFLMTGGTIDSHWQGTADTVVVNEHPELPDYFKRLKVYSDIDFSEVCMKDSRTLTPEDLDKILSAIEQSESVRIIVTHGTYTMPDTARFLQSNLKRKDQTIILTGSMVPLKGFDSSDAPFSLGYAIAKVQSQEPGVYIAMNGRIFSADEVAKNIPEGKFYSIFKEKQ